MLLIITDSGGNADDAAIVAGARPPSQTADIGNLAVALAASDVKAVVIEIARFLQADQTIKITSAGDNDTTVAAFILPRNA
jgi:hypothetical protein